MKQEPKKQPTFLGFASQKGGVGKSSLAEVLASVLYYEKGVSLLVVDCDGTQESFIKKVYELLELLYHAAGLIIDTLRTFFLIVLSILGPIVFGIAVWDGLSGSLTAWFSRYISVYLWLPVSSILTALLTKIQVLMIQKDIQALSSSDYVPDAGTWYYIVFFLIGIVGYFSVPTVAGWIIEAGGGLGSYGRNVNQTAQRGAQGAYTGSKAAAGGVGAVTGNVAGRLKGALIKGK